MDKRAFLVLTDAVLHNLHSVLCFELVEAVSKHNLGLEFLPL